MGVTQFYFELFRRDETVAGTLGDVEWIDETSGFILTDDPDGLMERLDGDEDVCTYDEAAGDDVEVTDRPEWAN